MNQFPDVCIIVPCHNEAGSIASVIDSLRAAVPGATVLVIDDASGDNTFAVASAAARSLDGGRTVKVLKLPVNLGVGGAVQTGFRFAVRHGFRYALKVDGDGQHPASEIPKLLAVLASGEADMAIGSRFIGERRGFQSTVFRKLGIRLFELVNSLLIGKRITDNTSGFRAYNRLALEFVAVYYPAFDYPEPEEVVLMGRNGFRLAEVPTPMLARTAGVSSINAVRSVYFMVKVLLAVLIAAMRKKERRN